VLGAGDVVVLEDMLKSGQWLEDDGKRTKLLIESEQQRIRDSSGASASASANLGDRGIPGPGPVVIPLFSMHNNQFLNLQINAFKFR